MTKKTATPAKASTPGATKTVKAKAAPKAPTKNSIGAALDAALSAAAKSVAKSAPSAKAKAAPAKAAAPAAKPASVTASKPEAAPSAAKAGTPAKDVKTKVSAKPTVPAKKPKAVSVVPRVEAPHPHSVANLMPEATSSPDQPFAEGQRDEIAPELRQRMITERAYRLYVERGCIEGYDVEDWLQAETEVDHLLLNPLPK